MKSNTAYTALIILFGLFTTATAVAATFEGTPQNYRRLLGTLQAGDRLELRSGMYSRGLPIHNLRGSAEKPIVVSGLQGRSRPVLIGRSGHNTVSILNSSHVHLKNLVLDGKGLPVDGIKAEGHARWAHDILIENLLIRGHGHDQQTVGISTKCLAWNWTIRNNVIEGAGTGIYLGNSDGGKPFIAGLIEHNLIVDSTGYNLQIKHQHQQPEIPDLPAGRRQTVIRHNLFVKSKPNTKEGMARPNVLVGHWPPSGPGKDDIYRIYANLFYDNPSEALFQGEGNIGLYSNLFVNPHGDAVHIQPHNDVPKAVDVFGNTVVATGEGIVVRRRENDERYTPNVAANAVFAGMPLAGGRRWANVSAGYDVAGKYLTRPYGALSDLDFFPQPDWLDDEPVDLSRFDSYLDWDKDFNGKQRAGRFTGAYEGSGVNPGWGLRLERKRLVVQPQPDSGREGE